jgi:hypothetical protein
VDGLTAVLDALAGDDLTPLVAPELLDRLRGLLIARNRLDAEIGRVVRECEVTGAAEYDGLKSMQSWLRGHGRLSPAAAGRVVRAGRALALLPAVAAACAEGSVTAERVAVIAPITRDEHRAAAAAQGVDLAEVDAVLAGVAATRGYDELRQVVTHYLDRLDPDGPEPDPTEGRSVSIARHADGGLTARVELDAVGGERFCAALESLVQAGRCAGDLRTRAQRLGDALVQLCDTALAAGSLPILRTVKPHVAVRIDLDDLADPAGGPGAGEMGFGATISAARARWLACDATVSRIVMTPDGTPLDLGRGHRVVPPAPAEGRGAPRPGMRVHRLRSPDVLVRRPPPSRVDQRRADHPGELRAALRAAPHQGPPRLPGGATTRRPLAHLATRRHRDPHRPTPAHRRLT